MDGADLPPPWPAPGWPPAPPARPRSARRRWGLRLAAVLLGLLLGATLAEIALRVTGWSPEGGPGTLFLLSRDHPECMWQCYDANPGREFSPTPAVTPGRHRLLRNLAPPQEVPLEELAGVPWCVEYRLSSLGFRDREYGPSAPLPPGGRIACVGDSFVFGTGVPLGRDLPRRLEAALGGGTQVMNLGQAGADARRKMEILAQAARAVAYDRILFVWIADDYEMPEALQARRNRLYDLFYIRRDDDAGPSWPAGGLRIAALLGWRRRLQEVTRSTIGLYLDSGDPAANPGGVAALREDFRSLASRPGVRSAVVLYPLMVGLDGEYPLAALHDRTAALAREAGLPVLDLRHTFSGADAERLRVHRVDHHPNGEAHGRAAAAIAAFLRDEAPGFLPAPPR